jgi:hypothetical protein
MKCENCGERIVGKPGRVGATRAAGNGFYKGSRPVAHCVDCVEKLDSFNAASAYRSQVAGARALVAAMRRLGAAAADIDEAVAGYGPAMRAAILAEEVA